MTNYYRTGLLDSTGAQIEVADVLKLQGGMEVIIHRDETGAVHGFKRTDGFEPPNLTPIDFDPATAIVVRSRSWMSAISNPHISEHAARQRPEYELGKQASLHGKSILDNPYAIFKVGQLLDSKV